MSSLNFLFLVLLSSMLADRTTQRTTATPGATGVTETTEATGATELEGTEATEGTTLPWSGSTVFGIEGDLDQYNPSNNPAFKYVGSLATDNNPWQLSLQEGEEHICGATLIKKNFALTSKQCVADYIQDDANVTEITTLDLFVIAGVTTLYPKEKFEEEYYVYKIMTYKSSSDIALLEIEEATISRADITPIEIATKDDVPNLINCKTTGWGTFYPGNLSSSSLLQGDLELAEESQCTTKQLTVHEGESCVVGKGKGSCNSDKGAPVVCIRKTDQVPLLYGTESHGGVECAKDKAPAVVTMSHYYRYWMQPITNV